MLEFESKCTMGIDLAGLSKNTTGIAMLKKQNGENQISLY
jgi:hypothetical protein